MFKEIKLNEFHECDGCKFHKFHITDGKGHIKKLVGHGELRDGDLGLEYCTKYKDRPERITGGTWQTFRLKKCIKEFTLFDMPKGYNECD